MKTYEFFHIRKKYTDAFMDVIIIRYQSLLTTSGLSFVELLCFFFCLVFAMPLCASVHLSLVVTCWERADLFALFCGV